MKTCYIFSCVLLLAVCLPVQYVLAQGSLLPPDNAFDTNGDPVASMKTLDQMEPRTAIMSLPFYITNSGAYYLVSSLQGSPGSNGIIIGCSDVQIDLRGFSMYGGSNSLNAFSVPAYTDVNNVDIHNGVIVQWGGWAMLATNASNVEISKIKMWENLSGGIAVGPSALIRECSAEGSGGPGISVGPGSTLSECKSMRNNGNGIQADIGCRVNDCFTVENKKNGIVVSDYSTVKDCLTGMNHTNGIVVSTSCLVLNNNCAKNGVTNSTSIGSGICALGRGNRIENNNLTFNFCGITVYQGGNRLEGNNIIDNRKGIVDTGMGNLIICNSISSSSITNLDTSSSSQYGAVLDNLGTGFTNSNPWANFKLMSP